MNYSLIMKKSMQYKNRIGLDHFYLPFSQEQIKDLKKLTSLPKCKFKKVKSGRDQWSGVYWMNNYGTYIEFITQDPQKNYHFGIAMSAIEMPYFDVRGIRKVHKNKMSIFRRTNELGKPWFDSIYAKANYKVLPYITAWAMQYLFSNRDQHWSFAPSILDRFIEVEIKTSTKIVQDLKKYAFWVPHKMKKSKNLLTIFIHNKDGSIFTVKAHLDSKLKKTQFVSLKAEASPFQEKLPKLKLFTLIKNQNHIYLKARKN